MEVTGKQLGKEPSVSSAADNLSAKIQMLRKAGFKKQPTVQESSVEEPSKSRNDESISN